MEEFKSNLVDGDGLAYSCLLKGSREIYLVKKKKKKRDKIPWEHPTQLRKDLKDVTISHVKKAYRASLVAQWLRICLLMQGTRVRALAWEDPTCRRAAGPVSHNC